MNTFPRKCTHFTQNSTMLRDNYERFGNILGLFHNSMTENWPVNDWFTHVQSYNMHTYYTPLESSSNALYNGPSFIQIDVQMTKIWWVKGEPLKLIFSSSQSRRMNRNEGVLGDLFSVSLGRGRSSGTCALSSSIFFLFIVLSGTKNNLLLDSVCSPVGWEPLFTILLWTFWG